MQRRLRALPGCSGAFRSDNRAAPSCRSTASGWSPSCGSRPPLRPTPTSGSKRKLDSCGQSLCPSGVSVRTRMWVWSLVMLKVIGDPFFLHQAAEESEIGLAILNAIVPRRVCLGEIAAEIACRIQLAKDLLDNLGEQSDPGRSGNPPSDRAAQNQGTMLGTIVGELVVLSFLGEALDNSVEISASCRPLSSSSIDIGLPTSLSAVTF